MRYALMVRVGNGSAYENTSLPWLMAGETAIRDLP